MQRSWPPGMSFPTLSAWYFSVRATTAFRKQSSRCATMQSPPPLLSRRDQVLSAYRLLRHFAHSPPSNSHHSTIPFLSDIMPTTLIHAHSSILFSCTSCARAPYFPVLCLKYLTAVVLYSYSSLHVMMIIPTSHSRYRSRFQSRVSVSICLMIVEHFHASFYCSTFSIHSIVIPVSEVNVALVLHQGVNV